MSKSKKIKAYIEQRNQLSNDITKHWNIIKVENKVNRNYKRNYDLKALYDSIIEMAEKRALIKLKILLANLGFKKFSALPVDSIQLDVFRLSELKEQKAQISQIKTLDPKIKSAQGKNNTKQTEIFSSAWKAARIKELDLQILDLNKKLADYNEENDFDEESVPMQLAA